LKISTSWLLLGDPDACTLFCGTIPNIFLSLLQSDIVLEKALFGLRSLCQMGVLHPGQPWCFESALSQHERQKW
jgi:hypothetical protein